MSSVSTDTFPRQHARTQRFTLGQPRNISVSSDGRRVIFLRSSGGSDSVTALWVMDAATGAERLVADPHELQASEGSSTLSAEEQAMRERSREGAAGITAYATDRTGTVAAFALAGRLYGAGLVSGTARPIEVEGPVFDPRPDPTARRIAYVHGRDLCVTELSGSSRTLRSDADTAISWGSADFIAAEEMGRFRGYWWSPNGEHIAACRVDTSPVNEWTIANPADPGHAANVIRYPAAGTPNPVVSLHILSIDPDEAEAGMIDVDWDADAFPYLASVAWTASGLLILVQSRDQRRTLTLLVDSSSGATTELSNDTDRRWVELVPGSPQLTAAGRLVNTADREGTRRIRIDGEIVTPADLQVRSIVSADDDTVTFTANPINDATVLHAWQRRADGELVPLTDEPGIHTVAVGGDTVVIRTSTLDEAGARFRTLAGTTIASFPETPLVSPNVTISSATDRKLSTALLLPHDHDGSPLPVLLDPYGGPHALRVQRSNNAFVASQWFADQGFAVVVTDGRGTPGRGADWERAVHSDLATTPLDDQIDALHALAEEHPELDLGRVAIRGWSFGGFLAALAVLKRPDVFHAAVAGAPVTEWRLYDTHYTERYLGDPKTDGDVYDRSSLLPLVAAEGDRIARPLLLIHGLADDNVVAAHTLQLSSALLSAGYPHEVLPLVGVTHMTPQEVVAENLLLHQLDFLRRSLPSSDHPG